VKNFVAITTAFFRKQVPCPHFMDHRVYFQQRIIHTARKLKATSWTRPAAQVAQHNATRRKLKNSMGVFSSPVFAASRMQRISDLHSKFALRPHQLQRVAPPSRCIGLRRQDRCNRSIPVLTTTAFARWRSSATPPWTVILKDDGTSTVIAGLITAGAVPSSVQSCLQRTKTSTL